MIQQLFLKMVKLMSNDLIQQQTAYIFCKQCGIIIPYLVWYKRKSRNRADWDHCKDCNATPKKVEVFVHPSLGRIACCPYVGEVNDLWQPINAVGDLYLPGKRICGHSDCVNTNHIEKPEPKTISNFDLLLSSVEVRKKHVRKLVEQA
jgi:hypothetical protein